MSRREDRDSHGKRLHSRSEKEPSPKRSKRDGKPATERTYSSNRHLDVVGTTDRDQMRRRRLQDALPLEIPLATETKVQPDIIKDGLDRKIDGLPDGTKYSSDRTEVPRSQSYFQHDERGSAGQGGRSSARRAVDHGRWSGPKEQSSVRLRDKVEPHKLHADENNVWRHDGFFELEAGAPPARKRPAFREKKMEAEPETAAAATGSEPTRLPTARREERGHHSRGLDNKPERSFPRADERNFKRGDGSFQRGETQRGGYQSRERFGEGGMRGRDRFSGRYGEGSTSTRQPGGFQVEKWKHDLFDEANRSPTPKNEEEQIAKVEALLAL